MTSKALLLGVALASFLTLGVVNSAHSFAGDRLEWKELEREEAGVDKDEIKCIPGLAAHWGDGYYWGGPPNIGYRSERIMDALGQPVIPPDNVIQSGIGFSYTVRDPDAPNHDRCFEDTPLPAYRTLGYPNPDEATNEGRFDWSLKLASAACQPGWYRITMAWGGSPNYSFERKWGVEVATILPCTIHVKDQDNVPIQGAVAQTTGGVSYTIGPTNVSGLAATAMPTGVYPAMLTAPNCQGKSVMLDHRPDLQGGNGAEGLYFTMQRFGTPPTDAGKVELTVVNKVDGALIVGAGVDCGEQHQQTGADGIATLEGLPGKTKANVHKIGFMGGTIDIEFSKGVTRKLRVKLSPLNPDGTGDPPTTDDNSGQDPGFWESLFVPKQASIDALFAKWEELKLWGPFGIATKFGQAWHADNVDGEEIAVYEFEYSFPFCGTQMAQLDFRPTRTNAEGPYSDGSFGTIQGSVRTHLRWIVGLMAWALFGVALVKFLTPRLGG